VTLFWIFAAAILAILWVFTIVDIVRRHYSAGATFGWVALILVVPYIGAIIYWIVRKPTEAEVEQAMLKNADSHLRH
jgi:hypothetical protein